MAHTMPVNKLSWLLLGAVVGILVTSYPGQAIEFERMAHIRSRSPNSTQAAAVAALIKRKVKDRSADFSVTVDPDITTGNTDVFQLLTLGGKLSITATTGVAAAMGFQYYVKKYCNCHFSWTGDQCTLPEKLPVIETPEVVTANDKFRYYKNICTFGYSMVWWDWPRWEREIDWMALNGINMPLAYNGMEAVTRTVFLKLGMNLSEVDAFFTGPAFLTWHRMGELHGWAGPLPESWHVKQRVLQKQILQQMRAFGMTPVLPAFVGRVPNGFEKLYPNVSLTKLPSWMYFGTEYSCVSMIQPNEPMFNTIATLYLQEMIAEYGTDHLYNADMYNEMNPSTNSTEYLSSVGWTVYNGMLAADPLAIWVMQGWLFLSPFWKAPQAKALLTSVPQGAMIILDLNSDMRPQFQRLDMYYGQPFIWCMLHNFGGTSRLYGKVFTINEDPIKARNMTNSTMIGTGLTPEGIETNDVIYEFMNENAWRSTPRNISEWFENYPVRRYGKENMYAARAWQLLMRSVYRCLDEHVDIGGGVPLVHVPSFSLHPDIWYYPEDLYQIWDYLLMAAEDLGNSTLFLHDLVDVTREALSNIMLLYYNEMYNYYNYRDISRFEMASYHVEQLFSDMDSVLATDRHFLLGRWLAGANAMATNEDERKLYSFNARNLITLWGPRANILDYANKQWSGLISGYYLPRWQVFVSYAKKALIQNEPFDGAAYDNDLFNNIETPFTKDTSIYSDQPTGDSVLKSKLLHRLYRPVTQERAADFRAMYEKPKHRKPMEYTHQHYPRQGHKILEQIWRRSGHPHGRGL